MVLHHHTDNLIGCVCCSVWLPVGSSEQTNSVPKPTLNSRKLKSQQITLYRSERKLSKVTVPSKNSQVITFEDLSKRFTKLHRLKQQRAYLFVDRSCLYVVSRLWNVGYPINIWMPWSYYATQLTRVKNKRPRDYPW